MYYINNFFLYSILGYLFESIIYLFCEGESGILYGFWTPVYGIGVCLLLWFYRYFKQRNVCQKNILFYEFLIGFFLLSFLEWIGGHLLELFFGITFWNYEGLYFNLGKYIALETSLVWGSFSVLCMQFLKPISDKIVKKIPKVVTWILLFLFILDLLCTIFTKSKLLIFFEKFF